MQPAQPIQNDPGRREAFRVELQALLPRLWRFALVLTLDRRVATDLVQAGCARVIERYTRQHLAGDGLCLAVMTRMRSIWANEMRRGSFRQGAIVLLGLRESLALENRVVDAAEADLNRLLAPIESLDEGERVALLLAGPEGFSLRETAGVLGISSRSLIARLNGARRAQRDPAHFR